MNYFDRQKTIISKTCQQRLKDTSVLIAGIGGLGSPVAEQLVRLGIGTIHILDNGIIDPPDLNRQIFYKKYDIGKQKVEVALKHLNEIGLETEIITHNAKIEEDFDLKEKVDFVFDCLDNYEARYYLDDYIQKDNIPMIHGGIYAMFGQVTIIIPDKTKSLRELFSNTIPKQEGKIPVISPVPSIIASIQVIEFVKYICKLNNSLINKMLKINLNDYSLDIFSLK